MLTITNKRAKELAEQVIEFRKEWGNPNGTFDIMQQCNYGDSPLEEDDMMFISDIMDYIDSLSISDEQVQTIRVDYYGE